MNVRVGAASREIADAFGIPHDAHAEFILELAADGMQLRDTRPGAPGPIRADLESRDALQRRRAGRGLLLARACGVRKGKPLPVIIDCTAGLGRDAHALAALGCKVTAIERNPVVFALLSDALHRSAHDAATRNVSLLAGNAVKLLAALPRPDVVFLDPMFPDTGRTALSRKEMQYFQAVLDQQDDNDLFDAALATRAHRIVAKRPKIAPPLAPAREPDVVFAGGSVRFDVYLQ